MATTWLFFQNEKTASNPAINDQTVYIDDDVLSLRNPLVVDSVFMGKLYVASITLMTIFLVWMYFEIPTPSTDPSEMRLFALIYISGSAVLFIFFALLTWYRIFYITRFSNFHFNRKLRRVYYQRNRTLIEFDWAHTEGGVFVRNEFGGAGFTTNFALAFGPKPAPGQEKHRIVLWVDSNHSNDPDPRYVAQVWEYIRQFMEEGPNKLPAPGEPNWWYAPLHRICLTPAEAWCHYAPWRTGEPGEMQGKKNWLLPMWLVLFPYNMFSALCWYAVCRVFKVRGAPPPVQAMEQGDQAIRSPVSPTPSEPDTATPSDTPQTHKTPRSSLPARRRDRQGSPPPAPRP